MGKQRNRYRESVEEAFLIAKAMDIREKKRLKQKQQKSRRDEREHQVKSLDDKSVISHM